MFFGILGMAVYFDEKGETVKIVEPFKLVPKSIATSELISNYYLRIEEQIKALVERSDQVAQQVKMGCDVKKTFEPLHE